MRRPYLRKTTWVIIVWIVLVVLVALAVGGSSDTTDLHNCLREGYSLAHCHQVVHDVTTLGAGLIVILGIVGLVPLVLIWLLTGLRHRTCDSCGKRVRRWSRHCPACGYDMRRRPAQHAAAGGRPAGAT